MIGLFRRAFLWGVVRVLEGFANTVGRFAAWAGLFMVLQQMQARSAATDSPFNLLIKLTSPFISVNYQLCALLVRTNKATPFPV